MATCGIKKYDDLPGRVGWIDVDYLCWRLDLCIRKPRYTQIPILGFFLAPDTSDNSKQEILSLLEKAYKQHHGDVNG